MSERIDQVQKQCEELNWSVVTQIRSCEHRLQEVWEETVKQSEELRSEVKENAMQMEKRIS